MNRVLLFGGVGIVAAIAGVLTVVAIQLYRSDDVDLRTTAPEIPTLAAPGTTAPTPVGGQALSAAVYRFVIDGAQSKATYVVREKLAALPVSSDAVGETRQISGEIYLTQQGLYSGAQSKIRVDLRTLTSDESRRDNYIRGTTLSANQYPFAEFTVTRIDSFPTNYVEGTEVALKMTGNMTIRGITRELTFDVRARQAGNTMTGIADTTFRFQDFGMTPPDVGIAKAEENIRIQIEIVATRQLT